MREKILIVVFVNISLSLAISTPWRPIVPVHLSSSILHHEADSYGNAQGEEEESIWPQTHLVAQESHDQCALYKVAMNQQLYFEYIHYKTDLPELKEFTLCMWTKFTNHSNDHPLFSYAVDDQPRGILSWVANTPRSSYYMMNIDGHNLYRLNYPLRLNKWYHSCQSWNGRTGEWQIWVNDERVGRGFNNRLVGHIIKGGGIAISGQEQRQLGGGFLEGEGAPKGSGGFLGELTMMQLYNVALTAGKAHKDHKHHHAHHYEHDTSNNVPPKTTTQAPVTGRPLLMNPFLTGGQLNHQVKINPGAHIQIVQNGVTLRHPLLPVPQGPVPQPLPPAKSNQLSALLGATVPTVPQLPASFATAFRDADSAQRFYTGNRLPQIQDSPTPLDSTPVNGFSFVDRRYRDLFKGAKIILKRDNDEDETTHSTIEDLDSNVMKTISKRDADVDDGKVTFVPREETTKKKKISSEEIENQSDTKKKRRGLLQLSDGSIIEDSYLGPQSLDNDYFSGLASFSLHNPTEKTKTEEREPAEAEVRLVMDICDGCADEPFVKALVMGWRSVPKKLYSGALHIPALPQCKFF